MRESTKAECPGRRCAQTRLGPDRFFAEAGLERTRADHRHAISPCRFFLSPERTWRPYAQVARFPFEAGGRAVPGGIEKIGYSRLDPSEEWHVQLLLRQRATWQRYETTTQKRSSGSLQFVAQALCPPR